VGDASANAALYALSSPAGVDLWYSFLCNCAGDALTATFLSEETRHMRAHLAEAKELVGAREVEVVDGQAVGLRHRLDRLVVDLHGAASKAVRLLQRRVLQEQRLALLGGRLCRVYQL
jgi:hypothetical protein